MKGQKGITLIALVITIIVMLILVVVTVTMSINGGLFDYAGKAAEETNDALQGEQELSNGTVTVNGLNDVTEINDIVNHYVNGATE